MKSNNHIQLAREIDEIFFAQPEPAESTGHYFLANTVAGEIGITITDNKSPHRLMSPIQSRLELGKYESLIRLLENWLHLPLDLIAREKQTSAPVLFTVQGFSDPSVMVSVHLPNQAWQQVTEPVSMLDSSAFKVTWVEYYAKVIIDQLTLSEPDAHAVKTGSTVLLASSFKTGWSPRLSAPGLAGAVVGGIDVQNLLWTAGSVFNHVEFTSMDFNDETIGEVNCFCAVTGKLCMDQNADELQEYLTSILRNNKWTFFLSTEKKAVGELLPIANGVGLHINQLIDCH